jgi:acetate kinase
VRVLVVNAGSSSLKLTLLDDEDATIASVTLPGALSGTGGDGNGNGDRDLDRDRGVLGEALRSDLGEAIRSGFGEADVVGHRIVHGGEQYRDAVRIDAGVEAALRDLVELAPLHQPKSLAALDAVTKLLPDLPRVACFDTAFHSTIPPAAATYALPARWRERFGLRRYGFHGLSHAWVARRAPELLGLAPPQPRGPGALEPLDRSDAGGPLDRSATGPRIVSCHLGAGASLCAISGGVSLDTTMGFTPLEGLVMATRSGSVDPGLLLWLLERGELSTSELADALEHRSGLLGLAGSADMGEIVRRAEAKDAAASLALDVYVHRLCASIAAMAAALGGLEVLAFTGGVGEHCAAVRARAVAGVAFLGVCIDDARNDDAHDDREIGSDGAAVRTVVLGAREDLEMARQVRELLSGQA